MRVDLDSELFSSAHALMTQQQSIKIRQWESWSHTKINSTNTHGAEPVTAQGCNQVLDLCQEHVLIGLDRESGNVRRQPNVFESKQRVLGKSFHFTVQIERLERIQRSLQFSLTEDLHQRHLSREDLS